MSEDASVYKGEEMAKQVCVIYCSESVGDDYYGTQMIVKDVTDWQEVSEEDYELLKQYAWKLPSKFGMKAALVVRAEEDLIPTTIAAIKVEIAAQARREAAEAAKRKAAKEERERKKQAKEALTEADRITKLRAELARLEGTKG